ncbi:DUF4328 domain-containing protein [Pseudonocardia zijingensis]|uniref:DUF4328 domain-containing protein n=1 Tax=Pseudonocardia zijingensis TaxID=153376 RepID=A0ABP3ZDC3_9PSEU
MVWVARVRDDIAAFAPYHRFRFSRRFAVGGLAIPFVNLWFSRRIIDDLWAGRPGPGAWIVRVWRACLVSAILLRVGGSAAVTAVTEGAALEDMLVTHVAVWLLMGSIVLTIEVLLVLGAVVSLAVIVRRIDGRRGVLPHAPAAGVGNERSASSSASTS